jgi:hypothetical protein
MFARFFDLLGPKPPRSPRGTPSRRRPTCRLECESLEGRQLLSVAAEFAVRPDPGLLQSSSANARAANGRSVVVWTDRFANGDTDIRAQVFD